MDRTFSEEYNTTSKWEKVESKGTGFSIKLVGFDRQNTLRVDEVLIELNSLTTAAPRKLPVSVFFDMMHEQVSPK